MTVPLVSMEIDLRDFPYMPLDVVRLRDSDLAAVSSGDGFRAAVILWCACWHQVPAASLPEDDRILANLAGFGRAVAEWMKVKEDALRGFIRCDDGRLYHPLIAEKANDAWAAKQRQRARTEAARQAKLNLKNQHLCDDNQEISVTESVTESGNDLSQAPRDRDRERDRDIEDSSSLRSDGARAEKPKSNRGSRLPTDWMPDDAGRALAAELLGNSGARSELAKFRDWAASAAGAKGVKADWNAAWRNWVRKAADDARPRAGPAPRPSGRETFAQFALGNFDDSEFANPIQPLRTAEPSDAGFDGPCVDLSQPSAGGSWEASSVFDFRPRSAFGR